MEWEGVPPSHCHLPLSRPAPHTHTYLSASIHSSVLVSLSFPFCLSCSFLDRVTLPFSKLFSTPQAPISIQLNAGSLCFKEKLPTLSLNFAIRHWQMVHSSDKNDMIHLGTPPHPLSFSFLPFPSFLSLSFTPLYLPPPPFLTGRCYESIRWRLLPSWAAFEICFLLKLDFGRPLFFTHRQYAPLHLPAIRLIHGLFHRL